MNDTNYLYKSYKGGITKVGAIILATIMIIDHLADGSVIGIKCGIPPHFQTFCMLLIQKFDVNVFALLLLIQVSIVTCSPTIQFSVDL